MRKILAALLALAMVLAIVPAVMAENAPITVTVFKGDPGDQPTADNKIYKKIADELGISFEIEFLANDLNQTLSLKIADDKQPDLFDGGNSAEILEDADVLIDLLPYISEEKTPNLYKHLHSTNVKLDQLLSKDGKLYIIPNYGVLYNDNIKTYNGPSFFAQKKVIEWNNYVARMEAVFGEVEKDMRLDLETCDMPDTFIPADKAYRLVMALCECPHGMIAMSKEMPGLVETSTNLASIKMKGDEAKGECYIEINTSQRSSIEASKHHLKWAVEQALSLACDEVTHGDGYPGWAPNPHSALLEVVKQAYKDLFKADPQVLAIHAGLECGLFLEKYPYLDMVSIGPQMYGVHSPQERLSIPSTERCYKWLCQTLQAL